MRGMSLRSEAADQGLTTEEFDRILGFLGREPTRVELGIFAALWSEHCSYKSTRIHLKNLPTKGPMVLQGPGENAGIIDLDDGYVLAFKIESHNHPSFIEPTQGAATGVGGILRDIFTMGARPIAVLDSLSFGEPKHSKTSYLVHGVVSGISFYGNCIGIPTVGGEVHFDSTYNGNNLVNVMAVGVAKREMIHKAIAKGAGNRVIYLGSKTGRDGIHGATMASEEFGAGNEERRPTVQVGDPFTEKLLLEACLEMMEEKLLVGIQDMGAAGIACSTFEMSSRGKSGMEVDLDRVPVRESGMNAWEIFLSESQERMLLVAEPKKVDRIFEIARKWEIDCADVGVVVENGRVKAIHHGEVVVDMEVAPLTDGAPTYDRPSIQPVVRTQEHSIGDLPSLDLRETGNRMIGSPNLSSRERIYGQYDQTVGADTVVLPGSDASVLRVKGLKRGIALTVDSNGHYCAADPYWGTVHVCAEAIRNLACTGAKAVATTNCLNYGNPEDPKVMGEIREGIRALGDVCRMFEAPVTGGNVSLYNQTGSVHIQPTPTIGMVGLIEDVSKAVRGYFSKEGMTIALLGGRDEKAIYESEFARIILHREDLRVPPITLSDEQSLQKVLIEGADKELFSSARDLSEGGLFQTMVECAFSPNRALMGATISLPNEWNLWAGLFGEYPSRALISFSPEHQPQIEILTRNYAVPFLILGMTGGTTLSINRDTIFDLKDLHSRYRRFMEEL